MTCLSVAMQKVWTSQMSQVATISLGIRRLEVSEARPRKAPQLRLQAGQAVWNGRPTGGGDKVDAANVVKLTLANSRTRPRPAAGESQLSGSIPQHAGVCLLSGPAMQTVVEVEKERSLPSLKAVSANTAV